MSNLLFNDGDNEDVSGGIDDMYEHRTLGYASDDDYNFSIDSRRQIENFLEEKALNKLLDDELYFDF